MSLKAYSLSLLVTSLFSMNVFATDVMFESGTKQVNVIELFTSEGCNSCPPAEEYLNSYTTKLATWTKVIPVAFHVDYWDYIGWTDRYADKRFGQRQSRYAKLRRASTVYTPAFFVNGRNWRPGFFSSAIRESKDTPGNLKINVDAKNKQLDAVYESTAKASQPLVLNIAILGMDLKTQILSGENEGRTANHEFVVVGFDYKASQNRQWSMPFPDLHYKDVNKYAIAAWVSAGDNPTPIQATGGLLKNY